MPRAARANPVVTDVNEPAAACATPRPTSSYGRRRRQPLAQARTGEYALNSPPAANGEIHRCVLFSVGRWLATIAAGIPGDRVSHGSAGIRSKTPWRPGKIARFRPRGADSMTQAANRSSRPLATRDWLRGWWVLPAPPEFHDFRSDAVAAPSWGTDLVLVGEGRVTSASYIEPRENRPGATAEAHAFTAPWGAWTNTNISSVLTLLIWGPQAVCLAT